MSILFEGRSADPTTLEEVIGQAVGAGSVCWENMSGTGIFDSRRAETIVNEVLAWIRVNYTKRTIPLQPCPECSVGRHGSCTHTWDGVPGDFVPCPCTHIEATR